MSRNHIVFSMEGERWLDITKPAWASHERLLLDKVRVSYDRTLKRLRELGLVEGGFLPNWSPYLLMKEPCGEDTRMS